MKSPSFFNYENFKHGRFSQLLKAKFKNNEKSSSIEKLKKELSSSKFEEKLKILVKKELTKDYSLQTIKEVLSKTSFFILQENEIEALDNEPEIEIPELEINYLVEDKKMDEVFKVQNRVPKWFKKPHQINSRILIAYLEPLEDAKSVSYHKP